MARFSKIVTTALVSLMLVCLMKNSILYAVYGFDRDVFIELFCINKDRPYLHCDGKCELSKILKEKQKDNATAVLLQLQLENQYFPPSFSFTFAETPAPFRTFSILPPLRPDIYFFDFIRENRKPPQSA